MAEFVRALAGWIEFYLCRFGPGMDAVFLPELWKSEVSARTK